MAGSLTGAQVVGGKIQNGELVGGTLTMPTPQAQPTHDIEADYTEQQQKSASIATAIFAPHEAQPQDIQTLQTAQAMGWTPETEHMLEQAHQYALIAGSEIGKAVPSSMEEVKDHPIVSTLKTLGFAANPVGAVGATLGGESVEALSDKYFPGNQFAKMAAGLIGSTMGASAGGAGKAATTMSSIVGEDGNPLAKAAEMLSPESLAEQTRAPQMQAEAYAKGLKSTLEQPNDEALRQMPPGTILNAEDTAALNIHANTRVDNITKLARAYMTAKTPEEQQTTLDVLKQEAVPTAEIIKAGVGVAAEHGRALGIHNTDWDAVKDVQGILSNKGDKDWDAVARALASIGDKDPVTRAAKVTNLMGSWLGGQSPIYKALVNAQLMNPRIPAEKIVTDAIYQPYNITMQAIGTAVRFQNPSAGAKLWTGAMLGSIKAIPDAWKFAKMTIASGTPEFEKTIGTVNDPRIFAEDFGNTIPGKTANWLSSAFGVGTRAIVGVDQFAKTVAYRAELHTQAFYKGMQDAEKLGLSGSQAVRQAEVQAKAYMDIMPNWLAKAANENMARDTFTDEDAYTNGAKAIVEAVPILRLISPFVRTPINLMESGMMNTPAAIFTHKFYRDIGEGGLAKDTALTKMAAGSSFMAWMVHESAKGNIIGNAPTDPKSREQWERANPQEASLRINGDLYSLKHIGPVGTPMIMAANYAQYAAQMESQDSKSMALALVKSFSNIASNAPLLENVMHLMNAIGETENVLGSEDSSKGVGKAVRKFAGNELASFIPAPLKIAADAESSNHREVNGLWDAIVTRIPGNGLPPVRDQFGNIQYLPHGSSESETGPHWWESVLNSINPITLDHDRQLDAVDKEQMRVKPSINRIPDSLYVKDPNYPVSIDPQTKDRWAELAGHIIKHPNPVTGEGMYNQHDAIEKLINSSYYKDIAKEYIDPDVAKTKQANEITKIHTSFVESAKKQLIAERPDLISRIAIRTQLETPRSGGLSAN